MKRKLFTQRDKMCSVKENPCYINKRQKVPRKRRGTLWPEKTGGVYEKEKNIMTQKDKLNSRKKNKSVIKHEDRKRSENKILMLQKRKKCSGKYNKRAWVCGTNKHTGRATDRVTSP
jgi:hypothetical protein